MTRLDDLPPQVPIVNVKPIDSDAAEEGPSSGAFRLSRTGDVSQPLMVNYLFGGTATAGADYAPLSNSDMAAGTGTITFPAGSRSIAVPVSPYGDGIVEGTETVSLTVAAGVGYTVGAGAAVVNLEDDPNTSTPFIQILSAKGATTDKLQVAKWENSFTLGAWNPDYKMYQVVLKPEFIIPDPDRFYVYVNDWAANTNRKAQDTITVTMNTTSYGQQTVTLRESGPDTGKFTSTWLMLVSNKEDHDAAPTRTFRVKLGDTVTATYTSPANMTLQTTASVPVVKTVKVHINILRLQAGGAGVIEEAKALADIDKANEYYAQVGIKLVATVHTVDAPAGVDQSNGFDLPRQIDRVDGIRYDYTNAQESLALLGDQTIRTAATDDVELYYVHDFDGTTQGFSVIAQWAPYAAAADSVFISAQDKGINTVAHEIGHVLTNAGHFQGDYRMVNLMKAGRVDFPDDVLSPKRLTDDQQKKMLSQRPNLLTGP